MQQPHLKREDTIVNACGVPSLSSSGGGEEADKKRQKLTGKPLLRQSSLDHSNLGDMAMHATGDRSVSNCAVDYQSMFDPRDVSAEGEGFHAQLVGGSGSSAPDHTSSARNMLEAQQKQLSHGPPPPAAGRARSAASGGSVAGGGAAAATAPARTFRNLGIESAPFRGVSKAGKWRFSAKVKYESKKVKITDGQEPLGELAGYPPNGEWPWDRPDHEFVVNLGEDQVEEDQVEERIMGRHLKKCDQESHRLTIPEPATAADHKQRLIAFYTKNKPEKLKDVDKTMTKYAGQEDKLFTALKKKYKCAIPPFGTSTGSKSGTALQCAMAFDEYMSAAHIEHNAVARAYVRNFEVAEQAPVTEDAHWYTHGLTFLNPTRWTDAKIRNTILKPRGVPITELLPKVYTRCSGCDKTFYPKFSAGRCRRCRGEEQEGDAAPPFATLEEEVEALIQSIPEDKQVNEPETYRSLGGSTDDGSSYRGLGGDIDDAGQGSGFDDINSDIACSDEEWDDDEF
jgi:hypothetical protein